MFFLRSDENKSRNVCFLDTFFSRNPRLLPLKKSAKRMQNNNHSNDIPKSHLNILKNRKENAKIGCNFFHAAYKFNLQAAWIAYQFYLTKAIYAINMKIEHFSFGPYDYSANFSIQQRLQLRWWSRLLLWRPRESEICISFSFHVYTSKLVVAITLLQLLLNLHAIINIHCKIAWLIVFCFFFIPFYEKERKNVKRDRNKSIERNRECMHVKWTIYLKRENCI